MYLFFDLFYDYNSIHYGHKFWGKILIKPDFCCKK